MKVGEQILRSTPLFLFHLLPFGALWFTVHWYDWAVCVGLYFGRMFGIGAGYHRYFAHRSFKTSRVMQFLLALLGTLASQKGVLWWAGQHRNHHEFSDTDRDFHSPKQGFYWSHIGWVLTGRHDETPVERIKEFMKYPELRFLNVAWWLPPTVLGVVVWLVGGWSMLFIGFFLSTVLLWHGTFFVNSLNHLWGSRRYNTTDTSRNNFFLAILSMGEGWHNNHHHYCTSANQGFYWYEIDLTFYLLKAMEAVGLIWDVRTASEDVKNRDRVDGTGTVSTTAAAPKTADLPLPDFLLSLPALGALPALPAAAPAAAAPPA